MMIIHLSSIFLEAILFFRLSSFTYLAFEDNVFSRIRHQYPHFHGVSWEKYSSVAHSFHRGGSCSWIRACAKMDFRRFGISTGLYQVIYVMEDDKTEDDRVKKFRRISFWESIKSIGKEVRSQPFLTWLKCTFVSSWLLSRPFSSGASCLHSRWSRWTIDFLSGT